MSGDPVLYNVENMIGTLTINRPENRNSMDPEVMPAFLEAIQKAANDRELRCLIITAVGSSFCSGADFKSIRNTDEFMLPSERSMEMYKPFLKILDVKVPVIAAMNGHAIGGGFGLALICDIRIANKASKYGASFARLGLTTGMAVSYMLPKIVGLPIANELLYTGRLINGDESLEIGLVNYSMDADDIPGKALELATEIAAGAPLAVRMMKQLVYRGFEWDPIKAAEFEAHTQSRSMETEDAREGIAALLEKRTPVFKGR